MTLLFLKFIPIILSLGIVFLIASPTKDKTTRTLWRVIASIIALMSTGFIVYDYLSKIPTISISSPREMTLNEKSLYKNGYQFIVEFDMETSINQVHFFPKNYALLTGDMNCLDYNKEKKSVCAEYVVDKEIPTKTNGIYQTYITILTNSDKPINTFSDGVTIKWEGSILKPEKLKIE